MTNESHSLEDLMALVREFVQARNWESFQKPSSLAVSAAIETGELLERFQWLTHEEIAVLLNDEDYRISIEDEIADVMIYMIRLADTIGIEPTRAILRKLKKNESKYPVKDWKGKIPDKVRTSR
ncbi:MAG: nucleotide pyrophosphohydrolase [Candidatus Thorarchaeota archaeon]